MYLVYDASDYSLHLIGAFSNLPAAIACHGKHDGNGSCQIDEIDIDVECEGRAVYLGRPDKIPLIVGQPFALENGAIGKIGFFSEEHHEADIHNAEGGHEKSYDLDDLVWDVDRWTAPNGSSFSRANINGERSKISRSRD